MTMEEKEKKKKKKKKLSHREINIPHPQQVWEPISNPTRSTLQLLKERNC